MKNETTMTKMRHSRTAFALCLSAILFTALMPSAHGGPPQNLVFKLSSHTQLSETLNGVAINDYVWDSGGGGFYPSSAIGGITVPGSNFLLADPLIRGGYLEIQTYAYGAFELDSYAAALEAEGGDAAVIPVPPPTTIDYSQSGATVLTSNGEVAVNITVIGPTPILQITNDATLGVSVFWPVAWASYSLLWSPDLLSPLPWQTYPPVPSLSGDGNYLIVNVAALELTNPYAFFRLVSNSVVVPGAPYVVTGAASPVNYTGAQLNGTILPNGLDTTYWFQWGLTASYGQSTVPGLVYGSNNVPVNAQQGGITGLAYGTTYHFQLFGSNVDGIASGGDQTFTTPIPPPAAIVATFAPSNITSTSALLQGTVNGEGSTWLGFFEWGTTTSYGNTTANFYYPGAFGPGATYPESTAISGLSPNTTYHYRIDAYNGNPAEALGNDVTFSTSGAVPQSPPTIQTLTPVIISSDEATLTGTYNPNGADTTAYFEYGLTTAYGNNTVPTDLGAGNTTTHLETPTYGLMPNTTYHCQLVAYNSGGTSLGGDVTFTTSAATQAPPTVQTLAASFLDCSEELFNGTVNPNGANTTYYFNYGPTASYGLTTAQYDVGSGTSLTNAYETLGVQPNTTYHYQVVAFNSGGTNYGADVSFTGGSCQPPPAIQTLAASQITATAAALNGSVNPNGADTHTYFQWGTTSSYGNTVGGGDVGSGSLPQSDVFALGSGTLAPLTLYHYRLVGYNSAGTNYGADVAFSTLPLPPSVTTQPASNDGGSGTLTFNGSVNPNGGSTTAWFQYGTTTNFNLGSTSSVGIGSGTATQPATATVSINNTAVNYYFRAVASNPGGETYGATLSVYGGAPQ